MRQAVEQSAVFQNQRGDRVVTRNSQNEVLPNFGYAGSSLAHGGCVHHGSDDSDWLPEA